MSQRRRDGIPRAESESEADSLPIYRGEQVVAELRDGAVATLAIDSKAGGTDGEGGADDEGGTANAGGTGGEGRTDDEGGTGEGDGTLRAELSDALGAVADAAPNALVLTGSEGAFDPGNWGEGHDTAEGRQGDFVAENRRDEPRPHAVLSSLECPVVAALRGPVLDRGFTLALCADLRVAGRSAEFGLPGLADEAVHGVERDLLVATVGRERARDLLARVRTYDAETAADWGAVNEVVPADAVADRALALAESFTHRSPVAYRFVKCAADAVVLSSDSEVGHAGPIPPSRSSPIAESETPAYETLELDEPREGVHRITLDRRRRLNALTGPMLEELTRAVEWVSARDPDAVVVEGSGRRAFSVGLDPRAEVSQSGTPADGVTVARTAQRATAALASLDAPTVAAVSGYALGGGLEVALATDVRVGGESSTYGLPEITHGLVPSAGGTQRLPGLVGRGRAMEMLLTGDHYDAETAADWGLVSEVVPDGRVASEALDLAEGFAVTGGPRRNPVVETTPTVEGYVLERVGTRHGFARGPFDGAGVGGRL